MKGDSLSASSTSKNPSKIRTFWSKIFCEADFCHIKAQNAVNPDGFTSILTMRWRKSAPQKTESDYSRHPKKGETEYAET
ncbi:MAG: hypothetical protein IJE14_01310 [Clostridia bacterium]|nr:hypothetical protein [Clostridia bacterium]